MDIAFFGFFLHVVEGIKHQQRVFQTFGGDGGELVVVQKLDQGMDVVAAEHGAQEFGGVFGGNQRACGAAFGNGGKKRGFDFGRIVHAGRYAVGEQIDQKLMVFAGGRVFQQFHQIGGLLGGEGQGGDAQSGALGGGLAVHF